MFEGPFQVPLREVSSQSPEKTSGDTVGNETDETQILGSEKTGKASTSTPDSIVKLPVTETIGANELLAKMVQINRLGQLRLSTGPRVTKEIGGIGVVVGEAVEVEAVVD